MFDEIPIKEIPIKEMRADSLTELDLKGKGDGVVGDHGPKDGYDGYSSCQTPQRRLSEPKKTQMGREKRSQLRADKSPIPPSTKRHRPSANLRSTKRARKGRPRFVTLVCNASARPKERPGSGCICEMMRARVPSDLRMKCVKNASIEECVSSPNCVLPF